MQLLWKARPLSLFLSREFPKVLVPPPPTPTTWNLAVTTKSNTPRQGKCIAEFTSSSQGRGLKSFTLPGHEVASIKRNNRFWVCRRKSEHLEEATGMRWGTCKLCKKKKSPELLIKPRTVMLWRWSVHCSAVEPRHMEEELIKFYCEPPPDHLSSIRSVVQWLHREEELSLMQLRSKFHSPMNQ